MAGMNGVRTALDVSNDEKKDFRDLNDKLAAYVNKVRGQGSGDPGKFLNTLGSVDDEVANLKRLYDDELDSLRRQLDAANREKNKEAAEKEKMKTVASDFADRFQAETNKNAGLLDEINRLQGQITRLEQELSALRSAARVPATQLEATKEDLRQALGKNQQLAAELDMEKATNKQLRDKIADLEQKMDFNKQLHDEQLKDANARLNKTKEMLAQVEAKNKELDSQSASVPALLATMRHKTDEELQKYKAETESAHNKNMAALKQQNDSQSAAMDQLRGQILKLQGENDNLASKARGLEGQIRELKSTKAGLEEQILRERGRSIDQIRALEQKLKDLQDMMYKKMQEANANRDVQVSLRQELETYRLILSEEEKRLGRLSSPTSGSVGYTNPTNNYGMASYGMTSGTPRPGTNDRRYMFTDGEFKSGQAGNTSNTNSAVPASRQLVLYKDMSEYQDSYCGLDTYRRGMAMNQSNNAFKTCPDGLPKLTPDPGAPRTSMSRASDVRGNGTFANQSGGMIRQPFPKVC